MPLLTQKIRRKPWVPWVRFCLVLALAFLAGWGVLELGQRFFGIQRFVIEQVNITGCQWDRLAQVQKIADELCKGKPLFLFDADQLQGKIESLRWVRASLIRREPPDRLTIVIEERQPLFMLVTGDGVLLMSDDGIIMDRVNQANLTPIPVVADPSSLKEQSIVKLIQATRMLKSKQPDFYARLAEIRWTSRGPTVFMEGLHVPIYLAKDNPVKNIPTFQALFLQEYANKPSLNDVYYFDLRWDHGIPVGGLPEKPTAR
jgi:cell division septal protein FtsQ